MIVNFVCRKSKARSNGLAPIELSIIIDGKRKYIALDRKVKPNLFNAKKQIVKGDDSFTCYFGMIRGKCYDIETKMIKQRMLFNVDTFARAFKYGMKDMDISLYGLFDQFLCKQLEKHECGMITKTVLTKYQCTIRYIKEIIKCDKRLCDFSTADAESIYMHLLAKMSNNSSICYMRKLKTMFIYAIQEGYINSNPITFQFHKDKVEIEPLTIEEIRTIREKEFPARLANIRDLFVFQCYTGLSFRDMNSFSKDDLKTDKDGKEWIVKKRIKTGITASIPILPIVKDILVKYNYILPTLSNQKYNSYLKEIQDVCGIKKNLHSHLARHTCGTLLLNAGVDMVTVSRILGHSTSKTTEAVYAKMLPNTIMKKVEEAAKNMI